MRPEAFKVYQQEREGRENQNALMNYLGMNASKNTAYSNIKNLTALLIEICKLEWICVT